MVGSETQQTLWAIPGGGATSYGRFLFVLSALSSQVHPPISPGLIGCLHSLVPARSNGCRTSSFGNFLELLKLEHQIGQGMQARASLLLCSLEIISLIIVINTNVIC
jgi:hypothetical protein